MIFGVSPTRNAVVIAQATGSSETFSIKTIRTIDFQARCGSDLKELRQRLVAIFDGGKRRHSTIALLGSSSGRFKSSVEAIKAEAIIELAAAESGLLRTLLPSHRNLSIGGPMSDPRNVAHAKKVAQEKKHDGMDVTQGDSPAVQPGKKQAVAKPKSGSGGAAAEPDDAAPGKSAAASASPTPTPPAALEGSLVVLAKLKELEFYSRANLERLAELTLTVGDELKQKEIVGPLGEVYSAQNAVQTKLTALIEAYTVECDRMQGERE